MQQQIGAPRSRAHPPPSRCFDHPPLPTTSPAGCHPLRRPPVSPHPRPSPFPRGLCQPVHSVLPSSVFHFLPFHSTSAQPTSPPPSTPHPPSPWRLSAPPWQLAAACSGGRPLPQRPPSLPPRVRRWQRPRRRGRRRCALRRRRRFWHWRSASACRPPRTRCCRRPSFRRLTRMIRRGTFRVGGAGRLAVA